MYVVNLHYTRPLAEIEPWIEAHRAFLDRHYASGDFLASGPKVPRTGGVILVRGVSRVQLDELIAADPFYQAGLAQYEVIEFTPVKHCPELANVLG